MTAIFDALETYVRDRISIKKSQSVEIDLKAGRGENGYSATIDIVSGTNKTVSVNTKTPTASKSILDEIEEDFSSEDPEEDEEAEDEEEAAPKPIIFG